MSALSEKVRNLPALPGVYLWKDARGRVLYVGKAKSLQSRVRSYITGESGHARLDELMAEAADVDTILTDTEAEALLLESTLVRQHKPHFNVLLKDDKSFPYVKVSVQEDAPRLSVTRNVRPDGARYLGPYVDVRTLRRTLRELRRVFPVRTCRDFEEHKRANRPCLYFHIKRCAGPCTTRSPLSPQGYREMVDGLVQFLSGKDVELARDLRARMETAAAERRYEEAALLRDRIALLETARVPQVMVTPNARDTDVIGVARHGARAALAVLLVRDGRVAGKESRVLDRGGALDDAALVETFVSQHYLGAGAPPRRVIARTLPEDADALAEALTRRAGRKVEVASPSRGREVRLLAVAERNAALTLEDLAARAAGRRARFSPDVLALQQALELPAPPYRMICFDISNLGAEHAVAAVVAAENARPRTSLYRRMRIRRPGPDDFAMIGEAVERYWTRVESGELPRPDLVVIDGGLGQVGAARDALARAGGEAVPLIGLAKREETVVRLDRPPLVLPRRSAALRALQRLRDEAHRFGLTYHRKLRRRSRLASDLERVPGVGPARRAALLRAFGSVAAVRAASAETIAERASLPLPLAVAVANHLADAARAREAGR